MFDGIVFSHIERVVSADHQSIRSKFTVQVIKLIRRKHNRVEVKLRHVVTGQTRDPAPAVGPSTPCVIHARCISRRIGTPMREDDFQIGLAVHHPVKNQMCRCHRGFQRVADNIAQIVLRQPVACKRCRMQKYGRSQLFGPRPERL